MNNEPAFPITDSHQHEYMGMTLRDYFAAQAITGKADDANKNFIARRAYELADAMLAERGK